MFTADGRPSPDDPREDRPRPTDERAALLDSMRRQRLTLELKCAGLDAAAMARRAVEPSTMSLLGIVRHLAEMERGTFRRLVAGQAAPRLFCSEADRDGDFNGAVADPEVVALAWSAWQSEVEFPERLLAEADLDAASDDALSEHGIVAASISLREIVIGMIEEYARHLGHVDLLRERIDGRLGQ